MYTRFPLGSFDVVCAWYPSVLEGNVFYILLTFSICYFICLTSLVTGGNFLGLNNKHWWSERPRGGGEQEPVCPTY
jgi:hypothetical protein